MRYRTSLAKPLASPSFGRSGSMLVGCAVLIQAFGFSSEPTRCLIYLTTLLSKAAL
jgi:hypothetical protein